LSHEEDIMATARVGSLAVRPVTGEGRRALDRNERLHRRYKEIRGKNVDWITHFNEDGTLYVDIRFTDGTLFSLQFSPQLEADSIELLDVTSGDCEVLKTYC
jgi:hypothetical protein